MRNLMEVDKYRDRSGGVRQLYGNVGDETCGVFRVPSHIDKVVMTIVASSGFGWDHVSVSRPNRCPNWYELEYVKRMFFKEDEVVMQLHIPSKDHISLHPNCLHLWRPQGTSIPLPPKAMVA